MNNKVLLKDDGVHLKEINLYTMDLFDVLIRCGNLLHKDMVITSANDGDHHGNGSNNSLHYENRAWDIRTHHLTDEEQQTMLAFLKKELGDDWDVLFEAADTINEHAHCEFDPK